MIVPGYYGPVTLRVVDTGVEPNQSDHVTVYPVTLSWVDNWNGPGGVAPGPDRLVNHWNYGLRGERLLSFKVVGNASVADLRIRMYDNKPGALGSIDIIEFDGESSSIEEIQPHCATREWKVMIPVAAGPAPSGATHTLTIRGDATSSKMADIELDLVDRQSGANLCFDGIGAVLEYSVIHTDLEFGGLSELDEDNGAYLPVPQSGESPVETDAHVVAVSPVDFLGTINLYKSDPGARVELRDQFGPFWPTKPLAANEALPFDFYAWAVAPSAHIGDIELMIAPVATVDEEEFELGGGTCRDNVKLTAVKATIKRDIAGNSVEWQDISGDVVNVIPGQKVNLKAELEPSAVTATAWAWSIEGFKLFKDYTAEQAEATLTDLAADDLDDEVIHFYWAQGTHGLGEGVDCEITLNLSNLQSIRAFDALSVKELWLSHDDQSIGTVQVLDYAGGGDWQLMLVGTPGGAFFECGVQDNETGGSWQFVQTVTVGAWATKTDGTKVKEKQNGTTVLDTDYPYRGPWDTDGNVWDAVDSPSYGLNAYTELRVDETFRMYVMYLPPGDEARWVPVEFWTWTWEGKAVLTEGTWTPEGLDQNMGWPAETNQHPTWTEFYAPGEWVVDPEE